MQNSQKPGAKSYLITKTLDPENQETPIQFIHEDFVTEKLFYRRNHFSYPNFVSSFYWFHVDGSVHYPRMFSLQEIQALPSKTVKTVLECAGNKRGFFKPKVFGEQWQKGAISQGIWKGVPLSTLFRYTGVMETAREVVFEGYDFGELADSNQITYFSRSLPIEKALHPDTIIAYEYNGKPLPFKHGFPLRLIVPEWHAMASVKWIKKITVIDHEFKGPFQAVDYVYYPKKDSDEGKFPVTTMKINSTIQQPLDRQILNTGFHTISGIAWTGKGVVTKIEVSVDGGVTWNHANLVPQPERYAWVRWEYKWEVLEKGEYSILSRAVDSEGQEQPKEAMWNRKGYGFNAIDIINLKVE
ncbi:sulfite oxidase [Bacillus salipaludis]|uniref:sulfite oxidase n=1 Tax=Bacillus salipaludis TaxID=2547811 RepID=UPI002E227ADB|nr:sulfite oxidase [Bacillus salipaludis]